MIFYYSEILLLVNLCVALGNAYVTPLPVSADDVLAAANGEGNSPPAQQAAPAPKKGAKLDPQTAAPSVIPPGSSMSVKGEDQRTALDVSCFII